ncbi:MAG: transglycosylase domain-containing protein [Sandaracinaceae bacterium]
MRGARALDAGWFRSRREARSAGERARPVRRWLTRALGVLLVVGGSLTGYIVATSPLERAPFVHPTDALTVTDRHGVPLRHHRPEGIDRRWVPLEQISPHVVDAVIATEDQRFETHAGVDLWAMGRAVGGLVLPGRRLSGASTITQQVIKLTHGRPNGWIDKPREIARALRLEGTRDKGWILEQYLNRLPYGDQVAGVARASELYFGVPADELSVAQAALLAGIPQAPSALDPRRHFAAARRRQRFVLQRMRDTGRIDEATYRAARAEPLVIQARAMRPWRAPRASAAALLAFRRGRIERHGPTLRTTLDLSLQEDTERLLRGAVEAHRHRGVTNGAAVILDNTSGAVLAYVGAARQEPDAPGAWLDLADAPRQPGSTLKPFVYELYFERGGTAASVLDDIQRPMIGAGGTLFEAEDYDGRERGPVLARDALSASLNLAALDAARQVGASRIVTRLRELGLEGLEAPEQYGAAIVLGGADVRAVELAEAYATLARGGTRVPLRFGSTAGKHAPQVVMDPTHAAVTRDILSDPEARRAAFGDDLESLFGEGAFGLKTGTSSGWRDAWTAAFSDRVTVVVWLGDPAGRALSGLAGFAGAARPATRILAAAHQRHRDLGLPAFTPPSTPLRQARVCAQTGHLAGTQCVHTRDERFAPRTGPTQVCDAHGADGTVALAPRYRRWFASAHPSGFSVPIAHADESGRPRIAHPTDGARLLFDLRRGLPEIPLRATLQGADVEVGWEVDGVAIDGARWRPTEGAHRVVARLGDRESAPVEVTVALGS